jgi:hypothetical protein
MGCGRSGRKKKEKKNAQPACDKNRKENFFLEEHSAAPREGWLCLPH